MANDSEKTDDADYDGDNSGPPSYEAAQAAAKNRAVKGDEDGREGHGTGELLASGCGRKEPGECRHKANRDNDHKADPN